MYVRILSFRCRPKSVEQNWVVLFLVSFRALFKVSDSYNFMQPNPETVWLIALLNIHKGYVLVINSN